MTSLLRANQLTKHYGNVAALTGVDFEVTEGITGLLGENGAGKSTSIKLFLGLTTPTGGTVEVMGQNAAESVEIRARLGYMPEHDCLPDNVSAADFLTHIAQVSGLPPSYARSRAADTLRHVGLFEERYRSIGGYSTGMKQRVKLAQALVHDPVLVLLDEPTAGLDPVGREEMLDLLKRTGKEFGISLMLSSHLMADVERVCKRIVVLREGRVVETGEVSKFTEDTETLAIEVDEGRERLAELLVERGLKASIDGTAIVVDSVANEEYDIIRDALAETGAPLRRMAPRRRELSALFYESAE
ncbi:MAG: ABC transporter ATP-binding protein [Pirellulaceae bacterium]|nr:ABC transporter ATP-binding protein [Pirellulaceae bacterium]